MIEQNTSWTRLRLAVLDRVYGAAIVPINSLYHAHIAVCLFYLAGLVVLFNGVGRGPIGILEAGLIVSVAVAAVLVPMLTGATITLQFVERKLRKLSSG